MKKKINFETMESLGPVALIVEEAGEAVNDKTRNILNSPISDVLIAACGVGVGVVVDIAAISLIAGKYIGKLNWPQISHILKVIGQGQAKRGALMLAIPAAVLAAGGAVLAKSINEKQLMQSKERLWQEAVAKLHQVLAAQQAEAGVDKPRADELLSLCTILQDYIKKLEEDLTAATEGEPAHE